VSLAFGRAARQAGIAVSMGSRGDAYDNAVAETFFATLKKELVNRRSWPAKQKPRTATFDYIEYWYNRERLHSTLGYLPPADYEQRDGAGLNLPLAPSQRSPPLSLARRDPRRNRPPDYPRRLRRGRLTPSQRLARAGGSPKSSRSRADRAESSRDQRRSGRQRGSQRGARPPAMAGGRPSTDTLPPKAQP
jgi:Integrase core domain